jgi:nitric oxide reductase subunit B
MAPPERWSDRAAKISFWSLNIGLAWMVFATLFPLGLLQLYVSVNQSYFDARTLKFLTNDTNRLLQWLRFPGDVLFIIGGVLPVLYLCWLAIRYRILLARPIPEQAGLFTEVVTPEAGG